MREVDLVEAEKQLVDLFDAAIKGETVVISKNAQSAVELVPVNRAVSRPRFGSARGLIAFSEDFEKPIEDFDEYLQ